MGLLRGLGYKNVSHYRGGMAEWKERNGPIEKAGAEPSVSAGAAARNRRPLPSRRDFSARLMDALGNCSIKALLQTWLWMIVGFGVLYWLFGAWMDQGLRAGGQMVGTTWAGLATALYFSFVTALSIGYGDVVPVGPVRVLAIVEGAAALLIFGSVISKLVSRHQEELTEEIHRIAFEDRLGRVRANLHLVLSEIQAITAMCAETSVRPESILTRVESVAAVFGGELRAIHDLLYRPQQVPDEAVLESLLANLTAGLRELGDLLQCMAADHRRSPVLQANLRSIAALADGICGECVPRAYAPGLTVWMDRIQELAKKIS